MVLHASGLPTIAAVTTTTATVLWPPLSGALASVPLTASALLRAASKSPAVPTARAKHTAASASASSSKHAPVARDAPANTIMSLSLAPRWNAFRSISPLAVFTQPSVTPLRSVTIANPLLRRSFSSTTPTPRGVPLAMRLMATCRPQAPLFHSTALPLGHLQLRSFGTDGISRTILASREAAANRNPTSPTAQNAFYQALLKANMPAIVVERHQLGRYASNQATAEAYRKALAMLSKTASVPASSPNAALPSNNASGLPESGLAYNQAGAQPAAARYDGRPPQPNPTDGRYHVVIDEPYSTIFWRSVRFLLWFALTAYLALVIITMISETALGIGRKPGLGGKENYQEVKPELQTARFSNVHGCNEAKEEVQDIVDFLRHPDRYNSLGGKMPKGVLLVGPPGTGKTLLARAVAGEAGVPFFFVSGSEFDEIYVGVGAKRVRELFAAAKAKSPSIIFIDELDAIGGRRQSKDASYVRQTLNQLLTEMDGFDQDSAVIVMAATNFPESLDKALTRPGRFDRHVTLSLPDVRGRIAILDHHSKKLKTAPGINLETIAARTSGLSGADLENLCNLAATHAAKMKAVAVAQAHFEWAKDKVIMGTERKSMVISAKEKEQTAYHEAGHALVALFTHSPSMELYKVTILPRGNSLGHTAFLPEMDRYSHTLKDFVDMIDRAMGGKAAEEIAYGTHQVTSGVSGDLDSATRTAWQMVGQFGMSEKLGPVEYLRNYNVLSSETRSMVETEVKKVLDESYGRVHKLLLSKRKELDLLAKALVEYETLDKAEVAKVLRGEKLEGRMKVDPGPMMVPKPSQPIGAPGGSLPPLPENGSPPPPPPPAARVVGNPKER
ncbi:mitochondrial inner membrane i-AAA protease supercomplex subunit YME1 [Podospora conica]|nr:mitochondrial inner membrane i-AAA protease supercomplex subunit YME1 [Schizothecium conicum]